MTRTAKETRRDLVRRAYVSPDQCDYVVNAAGGGVLACQGRESDSGHEHHVFGNLKRKPHARWRRLAVAWGTPGSHNLRATRRLNDGFPVSDPRATMAVDEGDD